MQKSKLHEIDLSQLDYPIIVELKKRISELSDKIESIKTSKIS